MDASAGAAPRSIGTSRSASGGYARVVDRLVVHGAPIEIRELARRAIPREARYLVLDLDRTIHLARNMGELLGWEICAHHGYGEARLAELERGRRRGRFLIDATHPAELARYVASGTRMWIYPGLFYFLHGKLAPRAEVTRRRTFRAFGTEPVGAVQRIPQIALMHHMSELSSDTLLELSRRLTARYASDQILDRSDVEWLREWCPGVHIVISSASPRPVVAAAAELLGVDEIIHSDIEEHEGMPSAPWLVDPWFLQPGLPRRIAPPSKVRINGGHAKVAELVRRHPDFDDPGVVTVGISDNGYGEDQCWAQHFDRVIDVNGTTPFSPVVAHDSPVREVHSAAVLTRGERARRALGDTNYVDPRRPRPSLAEPEAFSSAELTARLAPTLARVEALARAVETRTTELSTTRSDVDARIAEVRARIEQTVERYNDAGPAGRELLFRELRSEVQRDAALAKERATAVRPLADLAFELARALEHARSSVGSRGPGPALPGVPEGGATAPS